MTEDRSTRLIILVTVYGSALGSLPVIVHMINATRPSHWQEAQHMGFWPTLLLGGIGILGAFLLVRPLLKRFLKRSADRYGLFLWTCMAIIFALFVGPITGLLLPFGLVAVFTLLGDLPISNFPSGLLGAVFRIPHHLIVYSTSAFYSGLVSGVLFGLGGFLIYQTNAVKNENISKYGAFTLTLILVTALVFLLSYLDAETISRIQRLK